MAQSLKRIFKRLLHIGNDKDKNMAVNGVQYYYINDHYNKKDYRDIDDDSDIRM